MQAVKAIGIQFGAIDRVLGILEPLQVPLGQIRDELGIPGMGASLVNHFRDKGVMKTLLQQAGVPCARHAKVTSREAGLDFASRTGFPLVVKPPDGAGAKGTFRCEDMDQLSNCFRLVAPSDSHPVVLEEFVIGKEYTFDSVCLDGQVVWSSIAHYSPSPLEVLREPWIQWCVTIPRETDLPQYGQIRDVAQSALTALGMQTGLSHMEWFLKPDGSIAVSEVGCRPPGAQITSLASWAHDFDLYRAWAEVLIHDRFGVPERRYAAGAAYLRGTGTGKISRVHGLKEVAETLGDLVVESKLPVPGATPSGTYEGDGYIILRHEETLVVESALRHIINTIRVEIEG